MAAWLQDMGGLAVVKIKYGLGVVGEKQFSFVLVPGDFLLAPSQQCFLPLCDVGDEQPFSMKISHDVGPVPTCAVANNMPQIGGGRG